MDKIQEVLNKSIVADSKGAPVLTVAHIVAGAVGSVGLYLMIPERKRRNLFK